MRLRSARRTVSPAIPASGYSSRMRFPPTSNSVRDAIPATSCRSSRPLCRSERRSSRGNWASSPRPQPHAVEVERLQCGQGGQRAQVSQRVETQVEFPQPDQALYPGQVPDSGVARPPAPPARRDCRRSSWRRTPAPERTRWRRAMPGPRPRAPDSAVAAGAASIAGDAASGSRCARTSPLLQPVHNNTAPSDHMPVGSSSRGARYDVAIRLPQAVRQSVGVRPFAPVRHPQRLSVRRQSYRQQVAARQPDVPRRRPAAVGETVCMHRISQPVPSPIRRARRTTAPPAPGWPPAAGPARATRAPSERRYARAPPPRPATHSVTPSDHTPVGAGPVAMSAALHPFPVLEPVGVQPRVLQVGHPRGLTIRPDARRTGVLRHQGELLVGPLRPWPGDPSPPLDWTRASRSTCTPLRPPHSAWSPATPVRHPHPMRASPGPPSVGSTPRPTAARSGPPRPVRQAPEVAQRPAIRPDCFTERQLEAEGSLPVVRPRHPGKLPRQGRGRGFGDRHRHRADRGTLVRCRDRHRLVVLLLRIDERRQRGPARSSHTPAASAAPARARSRRPRAPRFRRPRARSSGVGRISLR